MSQVRILYCGNTQSGWTGHGRVQTLRESGFDVIEVNSFDLLNGGSRIERSLAARWHTGRGPAAFDKALRQHAHRGGFDAVFVDKGVWVRPATLKLLKNSARGGPVVHYTPDAQFLENRSRHFFRALPLYDLAVTTKPFELDAYTDAGAREVMLIHQGFGPRLAPVPLQDVQEPLRSDVCFIGHCQPHYADVLKAVAARVSLKIWGPNWTAYAENNSWAKGVVQGDACYGADYAKALSGAKIGIGLLSKRIPETTTTRSFEIPACGTFLLAERTPDHAALFEDGREAVFFDDADECAAKAAQYLEDVKTRREIAAAGLARCRASGYSTRDQFAVVMDWIAQRCGDDKGRFQSKGARHDAPT